MISFQRVVGAFATLCIASTGISGCAANAPRGAGASDRADAGAGPGADAGVVLSADAAGGIFENEDSGSPPIRPDAGGPLPIEPLRYFRGGVVVDNGISRTIEGDPVLVNFGGGRFFCGVGSAFFEDFGSGRVAVSVGWGDGVQTPATFPVGEGPATVTVQWFAGGSLTSTSAYPAEGTIEFTEVDYANHRFAGVLMDVVVEGTETFPSVRLADGAFRCERAD